MTIVLIGGTGTLGQHLLPFVLDQPGSPRVRVLSRHEHTQAKLASEFPSTIDWIIGDIRDAARVRRAVRGASQVYHLAATKRVEAAEYNPDEAIKTNIIGTQNVRDACILEGVEKAMFTSTDKAVAPLNLYGLTKATAEKVWVQGNVGNHKTKFGACRYGNVLGSQGSVVETWCRQASAGKPLTVTEEAMTRFWISPNDAAKFVWDRMHEMTGGEVFIPKMKASSMVELVYAFKAANGGEGHPIVERPRRPGEKWHECLVAPDEVDLVTDCGEYYIRWPEAHLYPVRIRGEFIKDPVYSSSVPHWEQEDLEDLCRM